MVNLFCFLFVCLLDASRVCHHPGGRKHRAQEIAVHVGQIRRLRQGQGHQGQVQVVHLHVQSRLQKIAHELVNFLPIDQ